MTEDGDGDAGTPRHGRAVRVQVIAPGGGLAARAAAAGLDVAGDAADILLLDGAALRDSGGPTGVDDRPVVVIGGDPAAASRRFAGRPVPWGHVPAGAAAQVLAAVVTSVAAGLVVMPIQPPGATVRARPATDEDGLPAEHLTPRELEVLQLVAEGLPNRAVADWLGISDHTVKFHLASIFGKLDVTTRTRAVRRGLSRGLIRI